MNTLLRQTGIVLLLCGLLTGATQCTYRNKDFGGSSQGDAITVGAVSAFGSIFVNGVEYTTSSATFTLNGVASSESALAPGRIVGVTGSRSTTAARARTVAAEDRLIGRIASIDRSAGTLTAIGQVVQVTGATSFAPNVEPGDVSAFVVGQSIAVDGYRTGSGLLATRIERPQAGLAFRVLGRISSLSSGPRTFRLGGTTIDYSGAGTVDAGVRNGAYVAASGLVLANDTTLVATAVTVLDEVPTVANGDDASVRGAVTRFVSAADFDVGGQPVVTSASTQFTGGASADVALDRELEIAGEFDRDGKLVATQVTFATATTFRLVGSIDRLSSGASTLEVGGITVATTARSLWDDRTATALRTFGFEDLRTGDWVEVRGSVGAADRTATAVVVERRTEPTNGRLELQGPAGSVTSSALVLAGTNVSTGGATFRDASGSTLTRAEFTTQAAGAVVRVRGRLSGSTLQAEAAEVRPSR